MKITLLCYQLSQTSGQSRFLFNIGRGLKQMGQEVSVCALAAERLYVEELARQGISLFCASRRMDSVVNQLRTIMGSPVLSRKLSKVVRRTQGSDWYVILADETLGIVDYLHESKIAYLSQGDLDLMFLNPAFYETEGLIKRWLAWGFVSRIRKHREWARKCNILLGNSQFTKQTMAFTYTLPFHGVVYPPVDVDLFRPLPQTDVSEYAVALVRNAAEQNLDLLRALASKISLKVIGGGTLPRAENMGIVSDEKLVEVLSGARVLAFPPPAELFGYPILESMSCGTPAVAFDSGGPTELIDHEKNGWLVSTRTEFLSAVEAATIEYYPSSVREEARRKAIKFSIPEMTARLLTHLR